MVLALVSTFTRLIVYDEQPPAVGGEGSESALQTVGTQGGC